MNLLKNVQIDQVLGYFAAAQTARNSTIIDMAGWDGVLFVAGFGTIIQNGALDVYVEQNTANSASGMARLATTAAHTVTAGNAALTESAIAVDVYKPRERYLRCTVDPNDQNAVILGVVAIRYKGKKAPVANSTLLASTQLIEPAEA